MGLNLAAFLGAVIIAITLWSWGQPLICTCGTVQFWIGSIWSSGNSQHIADWYTLSHIVHGMLVVLLGRLLLPRVSMAVLCAVAVVTGTGWEVLEHTDWVLGKFRVNTVNQGYVGDSVLNAVSDYLFMLGGFYVASRLRNMQVAALVVAFEVTAGFIARDSLMLESVMLIHRIEAIEAWQQEINPARKKASE